MTNESAERLRAFIRAERLDDQAAESWQGTLDEALTAERRATVERIRDQITPLRAGYGSDTDPDWYQAVAQVLDILDDEAAR